MYSAEPLPHFVDEYLAYLYEIHPTTATFDGVHVHDDLLEDLSRSAVDTQIRTLGGFDRRLASIDAFRLTDIERLERPALESSIRGRVFELEHVRTWERSPQLYADTLATYVIYCGAQTLTFAKTAGPAWLQVAANGALSGTPDPTNVLENVFTVTVSDGGTPVPATLRIFVNGSPKFPVSPFPKATAL